MSGKDFKQLADALTRRFVEEGFVVHRYDAYSTDSIYIKLDWGLCNSIRISDHPGYKHLKYRYNIGSWIKKRRHENDKYPRHYYPTKEADVLISTVLRDRKRRMERYGEDVYRKCMRKAKYRAQHASTGFFSHCREVKGERADEKR